MSNVTSDTIAAVATGAGGAISVIRVSGPRALEICSGIFQPASGRPLEEAAGYTLHYGSIKENGNVIDDVIVSVFRSPKSYTGEDMVEISCHGSPYIRRRVMSILADLGARPATAGEFTMRAFLAGKLDLAQAEAVADIIASEDRAAHSLAINQMRGGYSAEFARLRAELVELVSLLELELDFSEEDVQFADRQRLLSLIEQVSDKIEGLTSSYTSNNAIKEGVPVVIAGEPNTGKSTLLNALLKEERAIVSDIAGTTRDTIEESHVIEGVKFRFTDTAGLRRTSDTLENIGIGRAKDAINRSRILLYIVSPSIGGIYEIGEAAAKISDLRLSPDTTLFLILNKTDIVDRYPNPEEAKAQLLDRLEAANLAGVLLVSAKLGRGINELKTALGATVDTRSILAGETIVTNTRHYDALVRSSEALRRAGQGIKDGLPSDLLSEDIRDAVHHLGTITGEITNDEILGSIFSKFCIGK